MSVLIVEETLVWSRVVMPLSLGELLELIRKTRMHTGALYKEFCSLKISHDLYILAKAYQS